MPEAVQTDEDPNALTLWDLAATAILLSFAVFTLATAARDASVSQLYEWAAVVAEP